MGLANHLIDRCQLAPGKSVFPSVPQSRDTRFGHLRRQGPADRDLDPG